MHFVEFVKFIRSVKNEYQYYVPSKNSFLFERYAKDGMYDLEVFGGCEILRFSVL